ncbi:MAG: ketoacyl-ACP synthase III [Eubacterium sp.]|nr:ketoacyl-ACP synthase III [Eubacterium sp.]
MHAKIMGTGSYLPDNQVTNHYISTLVDTSDEWIKERTGIASRHISTGETTVEMAAAAGKKALEDAGIGALDVDLIIVATVSADHLLPSTACSVQKELGAVNAAAFDINAACSGFLFALNIADSYIQTGMCRTALLIGVETLSKITNWNDRNTCILFGDGAGAAVITASETPGFMAGIQGSDGARGHVLSCRGRTTDNPFADGDLSLGYIYMDGPEVFKFAVKKVPECIQEVLEKGNRNLEDVSLFLLHQANFRIIKSIAHRLRLPLEKFPVNVDECGNTSAASVPILLDETNKKGLLHSGELVVLAGFGAGLTWGAALLEW